METIISITYGLGGSDAPGPNGNVVERIVCVSEANGSRTCEVRDGTGKVTDTYTEPTPVVTVDPLDVLVDKLALATTLADVRTAAADAQAAG